jgi:hypothetical protein
VATLFNILINSYGKNALSSVVLQGIAIFRNITPILKKDSVVVRLSQGLHLALVTADVNQ